MVGRSSAPITVQREVALCASMATSKAQRFDSGLSTSTKTKGKKKRKKEEVKDVLSEAKGLSAHEKKLLSESEVLNGMLKSTQAAPSDLRAGRKRRYKVRQRAAV